jgi:hypothetical protein
MKEEKADNKARNKDTTSYIADNKARNTDTTSYMFGELSPPLMTPVFVDGAARAKPAAPKLEGGLVLHLRTLSHVLRAEAQRRGLGRARSDDPPQRMEHFSGGRLHPRGAHHPQGATPRPPSDLHVQVLSGDLMSPLEHRRVSSSVAWPSHIHTRPSGHSRSPGPFIFSRNDAPLFSPRAHFRI